MRGFPGVFLTTPFFALSVACAGSEAESGPGTDPTESGPRGAALATAGVAGPARPQDTAAITRLRHVMVQRQIAGRGVRDTAVLRAMRNVPRHRFVPGATPEAAYGDHALPIGYGQTISQPYIVAFMAEAAAVQPGDRVLEIGTGSGYGAAVLAELAAEVYTIEILPELAETARRTLETLGYHNVHVLTGNGWLGWPEHAPYDAVVVTAAPDQVPPALVEQLAVDGTMVVPVGEVLQMLRVLRRTEAGLEELEALPVRFVPMVGRPPDTGRARR